MNRTDRLVAMVMFLQGRRIVRAEELAEHFEISVRTVYRDLSALSEAGVPLTGEAGVGYSLVKGYHLPPVSLTKDEAAALFVGAEMVKRFTDASVHPPTDSALLKLRAVLPRDQQDHLERLAQNTVILGSPVAQGVGPADRQWLLSLQNAVVHRRVVRLCYRGRERDAETLREIEPLGVVFYGGAWYLVAWCRLRADFRHFRLDRMVRVEVTPLSFPARPDFSLARHLEETVSREQSIAVRVWFSDRVLHRARREAFAGWLSESPAEGGAIASLTTFSLSWMAGWLLSFGLDAEALDPSELRSLVAESARAVAERHQARSRIEDGARGPSGLLDVALQMTCKAR